MPPLSTPSTPTPRKIRGDFMRGVITADEYAKKKPLREDGIFDEFKTLLGTAMTVVTFVWKAHQAQGKFKVVP